MSPIPHLDLIVLGSCVLVALGLIAVGALGLVKTGKAFKARLDAYADLPVIAYATRASKKVDAASARIARAPALIYRANAAVIDTRNAFDKMRLVLTTPASIWRLGELLVTGK